MGSDGNTALVRSAHLTALETEILCISKWALTGQASPSTHQTHCQAMGSLAITSDFLYSFEIASNTRTGKFKKPGVHTFRQQLGTTRSSNIPEVSVSRCNYYTSMNVELSAAPIQHLSWPCRKTALLAPHQCSLWGYSHHCHRLQLAGTMHGLLPQLHRLPARETKRDGCC